MYKGPQRKFNRKVFGRNARPGRLSGYGLQLLEKQKVRNVYGIREKMLKNYFATASKQGGDVAGGLMAVLERRLDNVVYRMGFATSRPHARQIVNHGHIFVNGRRINIPSHLVRAGDKIEVREQSKTKQQFQTIKTDNKKHTAPAWLKSSIATLSGEVVELPSGHDTQDAFNISLVIEYYSR